MKKNIKRGIAVCLISAVALFSMGSIAFADSREYKIKNNQIKWKDKINNENLESGFSASNFTYADLEIDDSGDESTSLEINIEDETGLNHIYNYMFTFPSAMKFMEIIAPSTTMNGKTFVSAASNNPFFLYTSCKFQGGDFEPLRESAMSIFTKEKKTLSLLENIPEEHILGKDAYPYQSIEGSFMANGDSTVKLIFGVSKNELIKLMEEGLSLYIGRGTGKEILIDNLRPKSNRGKISKITAEIAKESFNVGNGNLYTGKWDKTTKFKVGKDEQIGPQVFGIRTAAGKISRYNLYEIPYVYISNENEYTHLKFKVGLDNISAHESEKEKAFFKVWGYSKLRGWKCIYTSRYLQKERFEAVDVNIENYETVNISIYQQMEYGGNGYSIGCQNSGSMVTEYIRQRYIVIKDMEVDESRD